MEEEYRGLLGACLVDKAVGFVRQFGGLTVYGQLWIFAEQAVLALEDKPKIEAVVQEVCCPLATTNYMGDGCTLWIDAVGRFYAVDSEGMVYLAADEGELFEVLLGGAEAGRPPPELESALIKAWEW